MWERVIITPTRHSPSLGSTMQTAVPSRAQKRCWAANTLIIWCQGWQGLMRCGTERHVTALFSYNICCQFCAHFNITNVYQFIMRLTSSSVLYQLYCKRSSLSALCSSSTCGININFISWLCLQVWWLRPSCVFERKVYSSACLQTIRFKPLL